MLIKSCMKSLPRSSPLRINLLRVTEFFLVAVCGGVLIFFQAKKTFTAQHISCEVENAACSDQVLAEWQKQVGHSLFFTDWESVNQKIQRKDPTLSNVEIHKTLPDQLNITYSRVQEAYGMHVDNQPVLMVNQAGVIVESTPQTKLFVVDVPAQYYAALSISAPIEPNLHAHILELQQQIKKQSLDYKKITITSNQEVDILLPNGQTAQLSMDQLNAGVIKLAYLLKNLDFTTLKQPTTIIDLRFKYPILKS